MDEYKPNSNLSKQKLVEDPTIKKEEAEVEKKDIHPVVTGNVKVKKQSKFRRLKNELVQEDADTIKSYIFSDVMIPALKKTIWDVCTNALGMVLGRGSYNKKSDRDDSRYSSRVSYRSFYDDRDEPRYHRVNPIYGFNLDDICFDDYGSADLTLEYLRKIMNKYHILSVNEFYEACGVRDVPYTAGKYGWTNIDSAKVVRTWDGYTIRMPKPMPLD